MQMLMIQLKACFHGPLYFGVCTLHCHFMLFTLGITLNTLQFTLLTLHFTVCSLHFTLYTLQDFAVYIGILRFSD